MVSFTDVTAFFDSVKDGGVVAHFLHNFLQTDFALCVEFKEAVEGMLHQRSARHGLEVGLLLFFQGMRRMVGGNEVDAVVKESCKQAILILLRLDGRVPLDEGAESLVVFVGKPEVVYRHFGGDVFIF